MKKVLCKMLIVAILMNFIVYSVCYADGQTDGTGDMPKTPFLQEEGNSNTTAEPSNTIATDLLENGTTSRKNGEASSVSTNSTMAGVSMVGVIMGYIALIFDIIPLQLHVILSTMSITSTSQNSGSLDEVKDTDFWITIERIVFNKIALLNINYFNSKNEYKIGKDDKEITIEENSSNRAIKDKITEMFAICRMFAIIIAFLVLIYIGIRMAISSAASEQAKYKKMLFSWVESIVIMFTLVYLMVIIISFGESLTNVFYNLECALAQNGEESFETTIVTQIFDGIKNASGLRLAMYSIMYWILVYTQFKFFYLYMKRTLMVGFLIMISPLVTITYPIDKAGDGQAQAFSAWMAEFVMNVLIQPLHAIIYLVFMFTAGEIAKYAPIIGLIFLLSLGNIERMVKRLFNSKKLTSLRGLNSFRKGK